MKFKKIVAKMYLSIIKKGFINKNELKFINEAIIQSWKNEIITTKDCKILTDICFQYELDNFYTYEI